MRAIKTSVDFAIRSDILRLDDVSRQLGIVPTTAFEKGDWYLGREKVDGEIREVGRARPTGVWHYCSESESNSHLIDEHVQLLLRKLTPVKDAIRRFVDDDDYFVRVSLWYVGDGGFGLPSELFSALADFCEEIQVTCWTAEEAAC